MTVESHEEMRLRAVTGRLELMDPERVLAKLRTGEEVKGSWRTWAAGRHRYSRIPLKSSTNSSPFFSDRSDGQT